MLVAGAFVTQKSGDVDENERLSCQGGPYETLKTSQVESLAPSVTLSDDVDGNEDILFMRPS
jgi:hypothetical protein